MPQSSLCLCPASCQGCFFPPSHVLTTPKPIDPRRLVYIAIRAIIPMDPCSACSLTPVESEPTVSTATATTSHHHLISSMAAATTTSLLAAAAALAALLSVLPAVLCQAPGPAAAPKGPPNVTAILEKGGQYTTLMRLMKSTQQDTQLNSQLNNSYGSGYTVFAPTDNAFASLKPGTLNKLSQQEQVSLVQFHILPQFYSLDSFETASNPVRTQASGSDGPYTLNITADSNSQVNVSTGVSATRVGTALRDKQPLAVYSVDKVLLPDDLFGAKPPASAPSSKKKPAKGGSSVAEAPIGGDSDDTTSPSAAARVAGGWTALLMGAAAALL